MQVFIIAGQKGGSGKSTLCWILANAALGRGKKVAIVDNDPQGSTLDYMQEVYAKYPGIEDQFLCSALDAVDPEIIDGLLEHYEGRGVDYLFIDTQGNHSANSRLLMLYADRIIIPISPIKVIFKSQMATVAIYEEVRGMLADEPDAQIPPCGLLFNNFKPSDITNEGEIANFQYLEQHPLTLPFYMPLRKAYKNLSEGTVFFKDIENLEGNSKATLMRMNIEVDLKEADTVLAAIEEMN